MSAIGTSRHFALRITCVALGEKRTSAPMGLATSAARLLWDLAQYRRPHGRSREYRWSRHASR